MKTLFDLKHPMLEPLWIRIAIVAVTLGWACVEYFGGSKGWAVMFAAAGLWCVYQFFVVWDRERD